ncbi:MAG: hypothetical protein QOF48_3475 [Verrucomicrobiota bacterium]|jgi:hypothetical protein
MRIVRCSRGLQIIPLTTKDETLPSLASASRTFENEQLMKLMSRFAQCLLLPVLLSVSIGTSFLAHGQTMPGKAEVRAVAGTATYSIGGAPGQPLKVGLVLNTGTTIKTGPESTVDLFLGNSAGVIRIAEKSTLSLDKLALTDTGADTAVEVQLNLPDGQMFFNVNKLSQASRYEIKVPNGVAGIRGTKGSARSDSSWVLLDGTLIFVYAPATGTPTPYVLKAPPAVYFTPATGLRPAPEDLTRGVRQQLERMNGPAFHPIGPPPGVPTKEPFLSPGTPPGNQ